ncbi:sortase B cell surface sorting signal [Evansella caseinilytica]|uniref:Sortase B cell surface sorting signal n=1 Tax=Evansella caseinilytica TaxID=1503961 RepID=A0A1H3RF34_9BACI|nr:NEAT domain-containing protein [Evansella caseinilytica]SDZ23828.1 sortase B cell surface sorting signal [Evansella caseinilytica]
MKKTIKKMLLVFMIFSLLFPTTLSGIAQADTGLADGEYILDFAVLKDGTDDASVMDGYTDKPGLLEVAEGRLFVNITLTNSDWIKLFQVRQNGSFVDAEVVSEDTENDTRVVRFEVPNLTDKLDAYTHVVIPFINYDNYYSVQLLFDADSVVPVAGENPGEEEETPGEEVPGEEEESPGEENSGGGEETPGEETPGEGEEAPGEGEEVPGEDPGQEVESPELAEGEYTVNFSVLKDGTEEVSVMDGYTEKPALLEVAGGSLFINITLTNSDWIKEFQVRQNGSFVDAEVVSENTENDTRVVRFEVPNLTDKLDAYTHVVIPVINYDNYYTVQFSFDADSVAPVVEDEETPSPEPEQPVEDVQLEDGDYTIEFSALHAVNDEDSSMKDYLVNPTELTVADGKKYVSFTVKSSSVITALQLEQNGQLTGGTVISTDEEANTRVVQFEIANLSEIMNAQVSMVVGNYSATREFRIAFNTATIVPAAEEETPGEGETPGQEEESPSLADGEYTVNFSVLKDGTEEVSVMDGYTEKPALLEAVEGKLFVNITLTNSDWIKEFQVRQNGSFVDAEVVSEDTENDTRVVRFEVSNLTDKLDAYTHVVIPFINYDNYYTVQFLFDADSVTLVGAETPGGGGETPGGENPGDDETPGGETPGGQTPGQEEESPELEDGEYTVDFTVLKNGTNEASVMDGYTLKPALLEVVEGRLFVNVTLTNSDWIKLFQVRQNGSFVDAEVVSEDTENDTRVVRFAVPNLTDKLDAYTHVVIPFINYDNYYTVQFLFDANSVEPLQGEYDPQPPQGNTPPSDPVPNPDHSNTDEDGLEFNRNDDTNNNHSDTTNENVSNAKTGDAVSYLLYVVMLFTSAALFIRKYRLGTL